MENQRLMMNKFNRIVRLYFLRSHELLEEIDLYPGQPHLLVALAHYGPLNQRQLSAEMLVKPATVTVMVRRMEKAGFVKKTQDTKDLRKSSIELTDMGKRKFEQFLEIHKKLGLECANGLTEEEIETTACAFEKIYANLIGIFEAEGKQFFEPHNLEEETTK